MFATFCGLGINNVITYENVVKANAKQNVILEVTTVAIQVYIYGHALLISRTLLIVRPCMSNVITTIT